jgi:pimeloyl-ACP methyl ester carboxylesterase
MSLIKRRRASNEKLAVWTVRGAGALLALPAAAAAGWIVYSAVGVDHHLPLPAAIDADRQTLSGGTAGRLSFYTDRRSDGLPLVLIHSVNAAASAYEMRPLFERYRANRPVWALDLPGFGFSQRSDRVYSPELYTNAILDLLATQVGEPADVVALSLGCEFAARAALARPNLVRSLALISPSGFGAGDHARQDGDSSAGRLAHRLLSFPLWAQALFDLIATRRSIRFYLKQSFFGPVEQGLVDYAYLTSHQPGARHAPLYFLSGQLFTPQVRETVYARVNVPVLVLYDRDAFVRFDALPGFLEQRPNWGAARIVPTCGLPQFEQPAETAAAMESFWQNRA